MGWSLSSHHLSHVCHHPQIELEPELVLLQLTLDRQHSEDMTELQRCIDEVKSHPN